jgi:hypothetical protein
VNRKRFFTPHVINKISIVSRLWRVHIYALADASLPFRPAHCYRFQVIRAHFEPESLPRDVGWLQLLGCRLQYHMPSDTDGGAEVSVHELHAFLASDGIHLCKDCQNSCPRCHYSTVIVSSGKHFFSSIFPVLSLRDLLFFAPPWARGGLWSFFRQPAITAFRDP